jgi:hypothetical protein
LPWVTVYLKVIAMSGYVIHIMWGIGALVLGVVLFFASCAVAAAAAWLSGRLHRAGVRTDPISPADPVDAKRGRPPPLIEAAIVGAKGLLRNK